MNVIMHMGSKCNSKAFFQPTGNNSVFSSNPQSMKFLAALPKDAKFLGWSLGAWAPERQPVAAVIAQHPQLAFTELMQKNSHLWFEAELKEDPPLDDFVSPRCMFTDKMNGWVFRGMDAIKNRMADFKRAYPDFELSLLDVMLNVDAKSTACHWAGTGTNLGPVGGSGPTGSRSRFSGVHLFTFDSDAKIIDVLAYREIATEEQKFVY